MVNKKIYFMNEIYQKRMEYEYWLTEYVYFMDEIYQNRMGKNVIWILVNRINLFNEWNLSKRNGEKKM